jgi:hypothetical protein
MQAIAEQSAIWAVMIHISRLLTMAAEIESISFLTSDFGPQFLDSRFSDRERTLRGGDRAKSMIAGGELGCRLLGTRSVILVDRSRD